MLQAHPRDRLVGHQLVKVFRIDTLLFRSLVGKSILEDRRVPLVRIAAEETKEVVKPQACWPQIKRTSLTGMPVGDVVVLAEPCSAISVVLEHLTDRTHTPRHERVVARVARCELHNVAGCCGVVITSGDQRGACRRAKSGRVELVEAQSGLRQSVHGGRRYRPAEGARSAEAYVIGQDQKDVR